MPQMTVQQAFDSALRHHMAGQLPQAEGLYRQILQHQPRHVHAMHFLGLLAHQSGRSDAAVELIRNAIALGLNSPDVYGNLANALQGIGNVDDAIAAYRQSLALAPIAPTYVNLGNALKAKGELDPAIAAYQQAIGIDSNLAEAWNNLGNALGCKMQFDEAIAAHARAIALRPGYIDAHMSLGDARRLNGQLEEAIVAYRDGLAAVALVSIPNPQLATVHSNMARALNDLGRREEALTEFREAARLAPDDPRHGDNILLTLQYQPSCDAHAIARENAQWNRKYALPLARLMQPHRNRREPDRRLRIGYVSPDLRDHAVGRNLLPLFRNHDRRQFEIVCYANSPNTDDITREFQQFSDSFVNIANLSDEKAAAKVREDQIDILVDLALHTYGNRLMVFASKPAPVQVTFAGYPASTGMTAIDYRLSDGYLDPPGMDESVYSEKTIRLPYSFWCYDPLDCGDIPVNPLPAVANGYITFGCLNNFCKINDQVLTLWSRVLRRVENARLVLLTRAGEPSPQALQLMEREGVAADRIEFISHLPRREYLAAYHRIDIGLDTFPYNGHTTSLDSFWMGVPVVTLVGTRSVARAGWCQLSNLQLAELAANTPGQFVEIAVELAKDVPSLSQLRAGLRRRMEQSMLMNAPVFASSIEAAYRRMWQTCCG